MLSEHLRKRLKEASSQGKIGNGLSQDTCAKRIDEVLLELHMLELGAFVTTARRSDEGGVIFYDDFKRLEQRCFYDYPTRVTAYKSFVKPLQQ